MKYRVIRNPECPDAAWVWDRAWKGTDGLIQLRCLRLSDYGKTVSPCFVEIMPNDYLLGFGEIEDRLGIFQAFFRLLEDAMPVKRVAVIDHNGEAFTVLAAKESKVKEDLWTIVANWEAWEAAGEKMDARKWKMVEFGFPEYESMPSTTFVDRCRKTLGLESQ